MSAQAVELRGAYGDIGRQHGQALGPAVRHNLRVFWAGLRELG